ncbi:hypothetical protein AVEN_202703-1 [Araneus ventricosus]|uniref:Uncharacterized protein n=1 Tax=Araneus ventricosus TaxID=182803 RepID=A0A4Y2WLE3_ARAVE|nr:hypothetical protein AVEN_202703-1 [Araneus ventricosus]
MESRTTLESPMFGAFKLLNLMTFLFFVVFSYSTCSSPQPDQVQESARPQKITNQRRTFKEVPLLQLHTIPPTSYYSASSWRVVVPLGGMGDVRLEFFLLAGSPKA